MSRPDPLARRSGETEDQHRALLLFVLQDPDSGRKGAVLGRPVSPVVRAVGYGQSTVRTWMKRREWVRRIRAQGKKAREYARQLYRSIYAARWGVNDMEHVGGNISIDLGKPKAPLQPSVTDQALEIARALQEEGAEVPPEEKVQEALERARQTKLDSSRQLKEDVLDALKLYRESLKAALDQEFAGQNPHILPARVKTSDIPMLHGLLRDLETEQLRLENPEIHQGAGQASIESLRVRIAKETGGDPLEAVLADCREILAIGAQLQQPSRSIQEIERENQETAHAPDRSTERPAGAV